MSATLDKLAYTTPEACRLLSIGPTTLYSLSKQGKLTPVKIGRATRWRAWSALEKARRQQ